MACAASPPLATPQPAFRTNFMLVLTHLDKPLVQNVNAKELLCLAAVVDMAVERAAKVKGAAFTQQQRLARIEALCRALAPAAAPADTLAALGLADAYPFLAAHLAGSPLRGSGTAATVGGCAAHLMYVTLLNQVVQMGTQLYHDALVPHHHKYAAHQIALLYQSLNMLQGDTKPIRRLVEARFDDIKAITEGARPVLPVETSSWLQSVTWVCREEVAAFPGYIHKRVAPLAHMAKADLLQHCKRSPSRGGGGSSSRPVSSMGGCAASSRPAPGQLTAPAAAQQQQQRPLQHVSTGGGKVQHAQAQAHYQPQQQHYPPPQPAQQQQHNLYQQPVSQGHW